MTLLRQRMLHDMQIAEVFLIGDRGHERMNRPVGASPRSVIKKPLQYDALYRDGTVIEAGCWAHYPERGFIRRPMLAATFL